MEPTGGADFDPRLQIEQAKQGHYESAVSQERRTLFAQTGIGEHVKSLLWDVKNTTPDNGTFTDEQKEAMHDAIAGVYVVTDLKESEVQDSTLADSEKQVQVSQIKQARSELTDLLHTVEVSDQGNIRTILDYEDDGEKATRLVDAGMMDEALGVFGIPEADRARFAPLMDGFIKINDKTALSPEEIESIKTQWSSAKKEDAELLLAQTNLAEDQKNEITNDLTPMTDEEKQADTLSREDSAREAEAANAQVNQVAAQIEHSGADESTKRTMREKLRHLTLQTHQWLDDKGVYKLDRGIGKAAIIAVVLAAIAYLWMLSQANKFAKKAK